jgi:hypothetical protein
VRRVVERAVAAALARRDPPAPTPPAASRPAPAGVAIVPRQEIEVRFRRPQPRGTLRVTFADQPDASLRSSDGTPGYAIGEDRIVVDNAGSAGSYELTVPGALGEVRVRVADVVVFRKSGGRVTSPTPADSVGGYTVPLGAGRAAP